MAVQFFLEIERGEKNRIRGDQRLWNFTPVVNFGKKLNGQSPIGSSYPATAKMAESKSVQAILAIIQSPAFASNPQAFAGALVALGGAPVAAPEPLVAAPVAAPEPLVAAPPPEEAAAKPKKLRKVKAAAPEPVAAPAPEAEAPKEKRTPNAWVQFSMRVQGLRRAAEEGREKAERTKVGTLNQFAGQLWRLKHEWADEEIAAAWATFTPPEVSKQAAAGLNKRPVKPSGGGGGGGGGGGAPAEAYDSDASSVAATVGEEASVTKPCRSCKHELPLAAFQKDSPHGETRVLKCCDSCRDKQNARSSERGHNERNNALARAARHQLKARAAAGDPDALAVVAAARAAREQKNAALLALRKAPKRVDLALDPWSYAGTEYYKNERGDVISQDGEWVGFWNGSAIAAVPEPADFDTLALRE